MNYDLARGLHILAVIGWMAGLLYLPRLYVYHCKAEPGSEMDRMFQTMEARLYRAIMTPAMIAALLLGLWLIDIDGHIRGEGFAFLLRPWMVVKLAGVVFLLGYHHFLGVSRKAFAQGRNRRSERFWRIANEAPALAAVVMVLAVTTEFGGG